MAPSRFVLLIFCTAETTGLLANSAFLVVFPWLVLAQSGNAGRASLVTTVVTIPTAVSALAGGRAIDRFGRKRSAMVAGFGCTVAAAGFGLANWVGFLAIGSMIGLGVLAQVCLPVSTTARDALMEVIAEAGGTSLERLAGVRQLLFSLAYAVGPALTGLMLSIIGPVTVMWCVSATWAAGALLTFALPDGSTSRTTAAQIAPTGSVWQLLRSNRTVGAALVIGFGASVITQPMTSVVLPAHFRAVQQPALYGLAVSAFGVGAILGAVLYATFGAKTGRKCYVIGVATATAGLAAFALLPAFWVLAIGLGVGGLGSGLLAPMLLVAVTRSTAGGERGRALGIYNAACLGASPIGLGLLTLLLQFKPNLMAGSFAVFGVWALVAVFAMARSAVIVPRAHQAEQRAKVTAQ